MLLNNGAEINARDPFTGLTLLMHFSATSQFHMVKALLEHAAMRGQLNEVIDEQDILGRTALHYATKSRKNPALVMGLLLRYGAAINIPTVLVDEEIAAQLFLEQHTVGETAAHFAVVYSSRSNDECIEKLNILASHGFNLEVQNEHLQTPLMLAAICCNVPALEWLISMGVAPGTIDNEGWTALNHAEHRYWVEGVDLLRTYMTAPAAPPVIDHAAQVFDAHPEQNFFAGFKQQATFVQQDPPHHMREPLYHMMRPVFNL
jgi:ankyrin repeat protein